MLFPFWHNSLQSGLQSGGLVAEVDRTVNFDSDHINVDDEVLNSSYESYVSKAAVDFANGSLRSVSATSLFPFSFSPFSHSCIICFPSGRILYTTAVILLVSDRLIFLTRTTPMSTRIFFDADHVNVNEDNDLRILDADNVDVNEDIFDADYVNVKEEGDLYGSFKYNSSKDGDNY